MLYINKITSHPTVDFAAQELKKYRRMMMPEAGDVKTAYTPEAAEKAFAALETRMSELEPHLERYYDYYLAMQRLLGKRTVTAQF